MKNVHASKTVCLIIVNASQLLCSVSAPVRQMNVVWLLSLNPPAVFSPNCLLFYLSCQCRPHPLSQSESRTPDHFTDLCLSVSFCRLYQQCSTVTRNTLFTETWRWVHRSIDIISEWSWGTFLSADGSFNWPDCNATYTMSCSKQQQRYRFQEFSPFRRCWQ